MKKTRLFLASIISFTVIFASAKAAESGRDIIVRLKSQADLSQAAHFTSRLDRARFVVGELRREANVSQRSLVSLLTRRNIEHNAFYIVNAISVKNASPALIAELEQDPSVLRVESDPVYRMPDPIESVADANDTLNAIPDSLKFIGVDRVWNELGVKGSGIVVGVQDTGFFWTHPALRLQYRGTLGLGANHNYNWHDAIRAPIASLVEKDDSSCGYNSAAPCDDSGHGTHVLGSIIGDDSRGNRIGVAPEAQWIGCRNMDRGNGRASTYLECLEYFLAPYPLGGNPRTDGRADMAPHIINNSWACPRSELCTGNEFIDAVRALRAAGILMVAAAGNDGPDCATIKDAPGSYNGELISVAANDHRNGNIADFSSRGPSAWDGGVGISVSAPGRNIRSSMPGLNPSDAIYDVKSGTSMASPHVAGVAALLMSGRPEFIGKPEGVLLHLQKTATAKTSSQTCAAYPGSRTPNAVFGFGYVNAFNALQTPMTPMNEVNNLPAVPSDPRDPGSQSYPYQMKVETFSLNNQAAELFLPQMTSPEPLTLIVYGHGQAINSSGYRETFNHLARKGVAVLHPNYDRGFFDQEWRRMAQDYVKLTEEAIRRFPQFLSNERVIYSGHSKGAYVALIAAGIPSSPISPRATILFAPAGFDREWLRNLNPNMPLSLFWSEADTTIQESLVTEIYSLAPSPRKQYFRVKSYANGNIPADHFFPLSKKFFFGGRDGISPYHYWGTWRWLMGAVWEADTSSSTDGSYLYGNEALEMGAPGQSHDVRRSW